MLDKKGTPLRRGHACLQANSVSQFRTQAFNPANTRTEAQIEPSLFEPPQKCCSSSYYVCHPKTQYPKACYTRSHSRCLGRFISSGEDPAANIGKKKVSASSRLGRAPKSPPHQHPHRGFFCILRELRQQLLSISVVDLIPPTITRDLCSSIEKWGTLVLCTL